MDGHILGAEWFGWPLHMWSLYAPALLQLPALDDLFWRQKRYQPVEVEAIARSITVALTGFMMTAYSGSSTTTVGDLMELDAIAACVIGGTALKGGRGTVWGVLFGALIMTSLLNGMTLLAVSPELKFIARGIVLTLAVWMDVRLSKR